MIHILSFQSVGLVPKLGVPLEEAWSRGEDLKKISTSLRPLQDVFHGVKHEEALYSLKTCHQMLVYEDLSLLGTVSDSWVSLHESVCTKPLNFYKIYMVVDYLTESNMDILFKIWLCNVRNQVRVLSNFRTSELVTHRDILKWMASFVKLYFSVLIPADEATELDRNRWNMWPALTHFFHLRTVNSLFRFNSLRLEDKRGARRILRRVMEISGPYSSSESYQLLMEELTQ